MAPRLELFAFRYRDPRTGKWVRARYVAELHELQKRYAQFEIIGETEIREVDTRERYFTPHQASRAHAICNLGPVIEIAGWKPVRRVTVVGVAT